VLSGTSKWKWAPQTTRDTPKGVLSEYDETELKCFRNTTVDP